MSRWTRAALAVFLLAALLYAGDYLSLRFRVPKREPVGSIAVQPMLAVPQKNGKTEFILGDAEAQNCSNSLFPQMGYLPCWYVARHSKKQVDF